MKRFSFTIPLVLALLAAGCGSDSENSVNPVDSVDSVYSGPSSETDKNRRGIDVTFTAGPSPVNLMSAGNFVILSKTGITNTTAIIERPN